jgi:hypothetical protein
MAQAQAKDLRAWKMAGRFLIRLIIVLTVALIIGSALNKIARRMDEDSSRPAGFVRGVAQGALMPLALPNLLVGRDMSIYSLHNTGRTYKLGYTVGVNGCGAIFFGLFFWRLHRLRKRLLPGVAVRSE